MTELLAIVPSRGRPAAVAELSTAFARTCTANTMLVFAVDENDPSLPTYQAAVAAENGLAFLWINQGVKTMVAALNGAVADLLTPNVQAVAFMGDDHRPRTDGWDRRYLDALDELDVGIVYGDDLLQGERIPTQVAMSASIIRALGHMAPPTLTHLFVDDYWRALGQATSCLKYMPDVIVEHVHPFTGKVGWDAGHLRVNAPGMYHQDRAAYGAYAALHLAADAAKVQALR